MGNDNVPRKAIEQRAYELYRECGCDGSHELQHWLAAEQELTLERWLAAGEKLRQKAGGHNTASKGRTA